MIQATGFVTAGGRSSRMRRDKAWLEIAGRPMIEHVIEALKPVTSSLAIIANSDDYQRLGFPVYGDTNPDVGPLEAIRTALANSPTPYVILVGCDMPFLTSELLAFLLNHADQQTTGTPDANPQTPVRAHGRAPLHRHRTPDIPMAIAPLNEAGKLEPLCALYSTRALGTVTHLIGSGVRKVSLLFERIPKRLISYEEIKNLQNAPLFFENINSPEDFARLNKKTPREF